MTPNLKNYRTSTEYKEILRILQKASSSQDNLVWQAHALGKNIVPVHHFEIDFVAREVVVYFDPHLYRFDHELPLYVKIDYRTSVFKITKFRTRTNSLHFSFPQEVKTQEMRSHPRLLLGAEREKFIHLRPSLSGAISESLSTIKVRALDVSYFGLGVMISEHNRSFLKNNRILWITRIHDIQLEYPLLCEVVYINNEIHPDFRSRKSRELKVGLKLSGVLADEVFNHILL